MLLLILFKITLKIIKSEGRKVLISDFPFFLKGESWDISFFFNSAPADFKGHLLAFEKSLTALVALPTFCS